MIRQTSLINAVVSRVYRFAAIRLIAKWLLKGVTMKQPFYNGWICFDAVKDSWMWSGPMRGDSYERWFQDILVRLAADYEIFVDIGSNIGCMTLSILLRNPTIKAVCVDACHRAMNCLKESIHINKLEGRIETIEAAVTAVDGDVTFDDSKGVLSHINSRGKKVAGVKFSSLVNKYSRFNRCLVKIDVEGHETVLLKQLPDLRYRHNLCLVVELHPRGYLGIGDPELCLRLLKDSGGIVESIQNVPFDIIAKEPVYTYEVMVKWPGP
ncbi:MAG: hypothetical protein A2Z72_05815 [Omnitrophica bacterium RBG_13_46_9]|nr:MAG: hypothetical protein A2Z72_05815 [Omnitrophica bacterium RBG_13_46_9]